jgi:hypothetical protein
MKLLVPKQKFIFIYSTKQQCTATGAFLRIYRHMMLRSVTQGLQDPVLRSYTIKIRLKIERWTHGVDHGEDDLYDVLVCVLGEVLRHMSAVHS